jgi:hypothetical protein
MTRWDRDSNSTHRSRRRSACPSSVPAQPLDLLNHRLGRRLPQPTPGMIDPVSPPSLPGDIGQPTCKRSAGRCLRLRRRPPASARSRPAATLPRPSMSSARFSRRLRRCKPGAVAVDGRANRLRSTRRSDRGGFQDRAGGNTLVDHALSRIERGLVGSLIAEGPNDARVMHAGPAPRWGGLGR